MHEKIFDLFWACNSKTLTINFWFSASIFQVLPILSTFQCVTLSRYHLRRKHFGRFCFLFSETSSIVLTFVTRTHNIDLDKKSSCHGDFNALCRSHVPYLSKQLTWPRTVSEIFETLVAQTRVFTIFQNRLLFSLNKSFKIDLFRVFFGD